MPHQNHLYKLSSFVIGFISNANWIKWIKRPNEQLKCVYPLFSTRAYRCQDFPIVLNHQTLCPIACFKAVLCVLGKHIFIWSSLNGSLFVSLTCNKLFGKFLISVRTQRLGGWVLRLSYLWLIISGHMDYHNPFLSTFHLRSHFLL